MDPTLCNRMLIMHLNLQQKLERNAHTFHFYLHALRSADINKINDLEDKI